MNYRPNRRPLRQESFVRSALVLAAATLVARIIGAFYRIFLVRAVGVYVNQLAAYPYPIYAFLLALSSTGINTAISKLISERVAHEDYPAARRFFQSALRILTVTGLFSSVLLFASARYLAVRAFGNPASMLSVIALAPAVLFVSIMAAYRGLFQGLQSMTPNAVSQVIEQTVRVVVLFSLAVLLLPYGEAYSAAGINLGALAGALSGLLYLLVLYRQRAPEWLLSPREADAPVSSGRTAGRRASGASNWPVLRSIFAVAVPISLAASVLPVMQGIDSVLVTRRLIPFLSGVADPVRLATEQLGYIGSVAMPLINVGTILSSALFTSLVPGISASAARGDVDGVVRRSMTAYRLTMFFSLPATVGLMVLPYDIVEFLFGVENRALGGWVTLFLAPGLLFLGLQQTTSGILQGLGKTMVPVRNLAVGSAVKFGLTYWLTGLPALGVAGAAIGTVGGFAANAVLNLWTVGRLVGVRLDVTGTVLKPLLASAVMALAAIGARNAILASVGSQALATLGAVGLAAVVYLLALMAVGGLEARDVEFLPRVGPRLAGWLRRLKLLRG